MNDKWAEREVRGTPFRIARNNVIAWSNSNQANERLLFLISLSL